MVMVTHGRGLRFICGRQLLKPLPRVSVPLFSEWSRLTDFSSVLNSVVLPLCASARCCCSIYCRAPALPRVLPLPCFVQGLCVAACAMLLRRCMILLPATDACHMHSLRSCVMTIPAVRLPLLVHVYLCEFYWLFFPFPAPLMLPSPKRLQVHKSASCFCIYI